MDDRKTTGRPGADVLIVGAGPTGLAMANILASEGIAFRIVDKKAGPSEGSRALLVQPRTLEYLDKLGLATSAVREGQAVTRFKVLLKGKPAGQFTYGGPAEKRTPYPFGLVLEQSKTEQLLVERLEQAGVYVEWGTELLELRQNEERATALVVRGDGARETVAAGWVVAADGVRSPVRRALGLGFEGVTHEDGFFLADVDMEWPFGHEDIHADLIRDGFLAFFPLRGEGHFRLLGSLTPELWAKHDRGEEVQLDDIRAILDQKSGIDAALIGSRWISTYRVHSRMAERFRVARVFLAGDAAHTHSPAASQGMNTGIGDAFNLAWKLAAVIKGAAKPELLDSYAAERMPVARSVLGLTDKVFALQVTDRPFLQWFRMTLLPRLLDVTTRSRRLSRIFFGLTSQIGVSYRGSPALAADTAGGAVRPGDRAPDGRFAHGSSLYELLKGSGHCLLLFEGHGRDPRLDAAREELELLLERYRLPIGVHVIAVENRALHKGYGARRSTVFLVRPDGHIAYRGRAADIIGLKLYLDRLFNRRADQE